MKTEEGQAQKHIPTKVQRIGNPGKTTALYIEDYVYTFLKQLLLLKEQEINIEVYGYQVHETRKNHIIITAAKEENSNVEDSFEHLEKLGRVFMDTNRRSFQNGIIQLFLEGENKQNLNGFYVFYDKNEPMQNYLIAWHQGSNREKETSEMTVKYAKKLQQNQFHQAQEKYWKQCMAAICLTFFIMISAVAITVINNYQKMMALQDHVSYVVDCMTDDHNQVETVIRQNADVLTRLFQDENEWQTEGVTTQTETDQPETEQMESEQMESEQMESEQMESDQIETAQTEMENIANTNEKTDEGAEGKVKEKTEEKTEEKKESEQETDVLQKKEQNEQIDVSDQPEVENLSQSDDGLTADNSSQKYAMTYSVAEGDTLQSILYKQYGSINNMDKVCELNQITDPDAIRIGQKLYLP